MFKKAIIEAFQWNWKFYLGTFGTAITTFLIFERQFQFTVFRSIRYGAALFVFSFFLRTIYNYILKVDSLEKLVREKEQKIDFIENSNTKLDLIKKHNYYGEVLIAMKDIFSQINKLKRNEHEITKKDITEQLIKVSNRLKSIFEKRLNYTYSVSIKVIIAENETITEDSQVQTIIRDEESYFERRDNTKNGHKHIIKQNTCYQEVIQNIEYPNKSIFFCNDLICQHGYKNSSFQDTSVR